MLPARILIVDDDPEIRSVLRKCFEGAGYVVAEAASIAGARTALASDVFHLVTVDVNLDCADGTREDGKDLALEIRSRYHCGIIMLSVITDRGERNNWLQDWADDTVMKPFQVDELLARTRAVLRRYQPGNGRDEMPDSGVASFAGWTLDTRRIELRSPQGKIVPMTMGDFNLLRSLLRHPQEVLSRDRIAAMDASIQTMASDSARAVDMRISRLRDRLTECESADKDLIRTVRGAGYMLVAEVQWEASRRQS